MTSLQDGVETWAECAGLVCKGWGHVASVVLFVQVASGRAVSRDEFPSPCLAHHCLAPWALRLTERDPPHPWDTLNQSHPESEFGQSRWTYPLRKSVGLLSRETSTTFL
ncbi:uncharacterized protein LOC129012227 [Pongo pygmaeus]|uniref:uncharacterized protein LOC129012227 n=1 Tax=Pongo pygmaeus TaxID=9600 RepID=UPI0023E2800F|nr:uncharacterized protein LOC129012227 [Pongo pygmaeus]